MIKVEKQFDYAKCAHCHGSTIAVKGMCDIQIVNPANVCEHQLYLCKNCREELINLLKEVDVVWKLTNN